MVSYMMKDREHDDDNQLFEWISGIPFFLGLTIKHTYEDWNCLKNIQNALKSGYYAILELNKIETYYGSLTPSLKAEGMRNNLRHSDKINMPLEQINTFNLLFENGHYISSNGLRLFLKELKKREKELENNILPFRLSVNKIHDVRAIANKFIEFAKRDNIPITNLKVQKLTYIAHGFSLAIINKPLIKDSPRVWEHGPIYPNLYYPLCSQGANIICDFIRENDGADGLLISNNKSDRGDVVVTELLLEEEEIIEKLWTIHKNDDSLTLSVLVSHDGTPWKTTYKKHGQGSVITNECLKNYYDIRSKRRKG